MKFKSIIKITTALAVVSGVLFSVHGIKESLRFKSPPPGYTVVTDGQGHWGAQDTASGYVLDESAFKPTLNSKQEAIDRAWDYYDYLQREIREDAQKEPKPQRDWKPATGR